MSEIIAFVDESGDPGWKFDAPYMAGGSSRHLTLAALIVHPTDKHLPKRIVRDVYKKGGHDPKVELKWSDLDKDERLQFCRRAASLAGDTHNSVKLASITVHKPNVQAHIRRDPNKLYNYMLGRLLLREMARHETVTLVPDPRSIKVKSGNSMHDYLQTQLWFELDASTVLHTTPIDSQTSLGVQFADMLSGAIQLHFESNVSDGYKLLAPTMRCHTLFFR